MFAGYILGNFVSIVIAYRVEQSSGEGAEFVVSVNDRIVTDPALNPTSASTSTANEAPQRPRFVAGIDLGTTNSALCYVDTQTPNWRIETFAIPQIVGPGQVENLETLPSFYYEALPEERLTGATRLPWTGAETARSSGGNQVGDAPPSLVGQFARDHGRTSPGRMIESAKSWLCHHGVDRKAALLPWHGAADVQRLSPVEVSASYLRHLREAWNSKHPAHPLEQQDVVLTIPASFDEVARELTVAAARLAGLPRVVLLEEPLAAEVGPGPPVGRTAGCILFVGGCAS